MTCSASLGLTSALQKTNLELVGEGSDPTKGTLKFPVQGQAGALLPPPMRSPQLQPGALLWPTAYETSV